MTAPALAACDAPSSGEPGEPAVTVRRAAERDRAALDQMFARCSSQTRYRRFHGHVNVLPGRYLTEALSGRPVHFALVAVVATDPRAEPAGGQVVALASCRRGAAGAAEVGLLVEDAWQRLGIGGSLLREIVGYAHRNGIRQLTAQILGEQSWIVRLLSTYGQCESRIARGVLDVTLRLALDHWR
jgi:GNAT superfamily N-acetyltransferase